ncbi:histidine kinase [Actinomadura sp. NBRC 104412]|uniref:sensor histidine kinase n=1 Tax=Actinomadura sp. NBRC 104412 TaxID=3032203 RepID=UPI002552F38B|nr:histidine kinase [Actinomadura sp. NBRC 104412]
MLRRAFRTALRPVRPVAGRAFWRRWSYLVGGGALLMPYWFVSMAAVPALRLGATFTVALCFLLPPLGTFVTGLVPAVRLLEGAAAKELLGGPITGLATGPSRTWEDRARTGLWFTLHLHAGVVVSGLSLLVPPFAAVLILAPVVRWDDDFLSKSGAPDIFPKWPLPFAGVATLAAMLAVIMVSGTVLSRLAPRLLGPSAADRVAELEQRAVRLAERNRLARELHDSVGHALSVVTLQAGAARRVLDHDPVFAREALGAIEESARSALRDLDHVLGLLREDASRTAPQSTLKDLDRLLERTRIAGIELDSKVGPEVDEVPAAVSREAYRIVQEGLTNALRHAGRVPVRLWIGVRGDRLEVEMSNPLGSAGDRAGRTGGGRGLRGVRERVTVLGGVMDAGPDGAGRWRLEVTLPLGMRP